MGVAVRRPAGHRGPAAARSASRCFPTWAERPRRTATAISGNPFDDGRNLRSRAGVDLKMGIGPNLTLDATFNPDFGQVEADPSEVNLTAFETFFVEKRPFFTEGAAPPEHGPGHQLLLLASHRRDAGDGGARATSWTIRRRRRSSAPRSSPAACRRGRRSACWPRSRTEDFARVSNLGSPAIDRTSGSLRARPTALVRVQQEFGASSSTVGGDGHGAASRPRGRRSAGRAAAAQRVRRRRRFGPALPERRSIRSASFAGFTFVNGEAERDRARSSGRPRTTSSAPIATYWTIRSDAARPWRDTRRASASSAPAAGTGSGAAT